MALELIKEDIIEYIRENGWTAIIEEATPDKSMEELVSLTGQVDNFRSDERTHTY